MNDHRPKVASHPNEVPRLDPDEIAPRPQASRLPQLDMEALAARTSKADGTLTVETEAPRADLHRRFMATVQADRLDDRPHFPRWVDTAELCGQCAAPWPCEWAIRSGVAE